MSPQTIEIMARGDRAEETAAAARSELARTIARAQADHEERERAKREPFDFRPQPPPDAGRLP